MLSNNPDAAANKGNTKQIAVENIPPSITGSELEVRTRTAAEAIYAILDRDAPTPGKKKQAASQTDAS